MIATETPLWHYYSTVSVQQSTDYFSAKRCIQLLEDEGVKGLWILEPYEGGHVKFRLRVECVDGLATVDFTLGANELEVAEKRYVQGIVREWYPKKVGDDWKVKRALANSLNCTVMG